MRKGKAVIMHSIDSFRPKNYWVRYMAGNGKILANSETFPTKRLCMTNIRSMQKIFGVGLRIEDPETL